MHVINLLMIFMMTLFIITKLSLLLSHRFNLHVIYLARDPRGILNSVGFLKTSNYKFHSKSKTNSKLMHRSELFPPSGHPGCLVPSTFAQGATSVFVFVCICIFVYLYCVYLHICICNPWISPLQATQRLRPHCQP